MPASSSRSYLFEKGSVQAQAIFRDRASRHVELLTPALMPYEFSNALLVAVRKGRLPEARAPEILERFVRLKVFTRSLDNLEARSWELAWEHGCTFYDAAYLALAEFERVQFVMGDRRLYNAVRGKLNRVLWIEDYTPQTGQSRKQQ